MSIHRFKKKPPVNLQVHTPESHKITNKKRTKTFNILTCSYIGASNKNQTSNCKREKKQVQREKKQVQLPLT